MKQYRLAAQAALVVAMSIGSVSMPRAGGIPVIDVASIAKQIQHYTTQVQQYTTQLKQYENMLKNTAAPAAYIWDQVQTTIDQLVSASNTLNYLKNEEGSLDVHLDKYQNVDFYRSSPCFSADGCTAEEREKLEQNRRLASQVQKQANDALLKGLDLQQRNLKTDAAHLAKLQASAATATGRLEAAAYANQLASAQANQLMQLRALLVAQQTAEAVRRQATLDREAREQAEWEHLLRGEFRPSTPRSWTVR